MVEKLSIGHKKETFAQFTERYKMLANPIFINNVMRGFTQRMDLKLKKRLESLSSHPKDTGLLQQSWQVPLNYLQTHSGKAWQVYLLNTATVGKQKQLKYSKEGYTRRKKKLVGRHNLKRYFPFVEKRTKFYIKQVRVIRNMLDREFKEFMRSVIRELAIKGIIAQEEAIIMIKDITENV